MGAIALAADTARMAFAEFPDPAIVVDHDLVVVAWNAAASRVLGWAADDVVGVVDPSIAERARAAAKEALGVLAAGGTDPEALDPLLERRRQDGTSVRLVLRSSFRPGDGHVGMVLSDDLREDRRLQQRNRLSRRLVEAVRAEDVAAVLTDAVRELLGAERAAVLERCAPGDHLHGIRALGGYQEEVEQIELPWEPGAAWVRAAEGHAAPGRLVVAGREVDALFVPMGPRDRGVVFAVARDDIPDDAATVGIARAVADEAWLAFQRAELVGELEGKVEILEATAAVASVAGLDLERTLQSVAAHAASALSCERAAIYLRSSAGELELAALYATDLDVETEEGGRTAREVLDRGEEVVVQDTTDCQFLDGPWHREIGAVSVFGLPLRVGSRDLGALVVAHTVANPRGFTSLCRQVGASVAQQAALAIEHARLYGAEQENVRRLEELDQLKADYVAGISHDLKTPLTGLVGFTKTLNRLGENLDPDRLRRYLGLMERQALRIAAMVEDLLLAARFERGDVQPRSPTEVDLSGVLADALDLYTPEQRRRIEVDVGEPDPVRADESQILRVVHNLIDNALKYSPDETPVRVVLTGEGDTVVFAVRDHGPGVAPAERHRIFERFATGESGRAQGSTGLGLFISRGIARGHGGDLLYREPDDGDGSCFELRLPRLGIRDQ